jgi:hypothetical protein
MQNTRYEITLRNNQLPIIKGVKLWKHISQIPKLQTLPVFYQSKCYFKRLVQPQISEFDNAGKLKVALPF